MNKDRRIVVVTSTLAGVAAVLVFLATALSKLGQYPSLPERVSNVERGQQEMGRRIDTITTDVSSMRRDMDAYNRRSEDSFNGVTRLLSSIKGTLQDVRDQGMRVTTELAAVREKAVNAAIIADEANKLALEGKARSDAEAKLKAQK